MYNPSLREEPRHKTAEVIPVKQETSILDWLEANGRLLARDIPDDRYLEDEVEISELMAVDDTSLDYEEDVVEDDFEEA